MGLTILRTPARAPQANAFCKRVIGIRRECLDWMIPLNEGHLRRVLQQWVAHYNRGRPHTSLGPGIPEGLDIAMPSRGPITPPHPTSTRFTHTTAWVEARVQLSRFVSVWVQRTDLRRDHFPHHTRNLGHYAFKSEGVDPRVETKRVSVCTQRLRRRSGISGSPDATEHCPIRPT
jgi:Integrase core domain